MKKQIFPVTVILLMLFLLGSGCHKGGSPYYKAEVTETVRFDGTVLQYLESQKGVYDSMVLVIKRFPDFTKLLSSPGAMTVFAIPNAAFQVAVTNFNRERAKLDSAPLYFSPNDLSRPDSGMFHYLGLQQLIAHYIFNKVYTYEDLVVSTNGFAAPSILGYEMNLKAVQQNAVGAIKDGPKVIEFSDRNNSQFNRFWKSALTSTISAVQTSNALVHTLTQNHEFGFASFANRLLEPAWDRAGWTPIAWHSQYLGNWGGTVAHALDNDGSTRWHTLVSNPPPLPIYFTVDMKQTILIGGVTIQVRTDGGHDGSPVDFTVQFAKEGADLTDSSAWVSQRCAYPPDNGTIKLPHKFFFDSKVEARYFRFIVNQVFSGRLYTDRPYSNLDEIWMLY